MCLRGLKPTLRNQEPRTPNMSSLRQLLRSTLDAVLPPALFLTRGRNLACGEASIRPAISLTFDDGPHPEFTPRLLDNLASAGIHATFFVVGEPAEKYPLIVRRMADEGHEVGNHTWSHREPRDVSTAQFVEEIRRTGRLIHDITGNACRLARPPKGELTAGKMWALVRERQTVVLWNRDPRDYRMTSDCEIEDWCRSYQPSHGDIVLMHDIQPHAATAAFLMGTLTPHSELRYVTVSEWVGEFSIFDF